MAQMFGGTDRSTSSSSRASNQAEPRIHTAGLATSFVGRARPRAGRPMGPTTSVMTTAIAIARIAIATVSRTPPTSTDHPPRWQRRWPQILSQPGGRTASPIGGQAAEADTGDDPREHDPGHHGEGGPSHPSRRSYHDRRRVPQAARTRPRSTPQPCRRRPVRSGHRAARSASDPGAPQVDHRRQQPAPRRPTSTPRSSSATAGSPTAPGRDRRPRRPRARRTTGWRTRTCRRSTTAAAASLRGSRAKRERRRHASSPAFRNDRNGPRALRRGSRRTPWRSGPRTAGRSPGRPPAGRGRGRSRTTAPRSARGWRGRRPGRRGASAAATRTGHGGRAGPRRCR